jgi:hypothetical protein
MTKLRWWEILFQHGAGLVAWITMLYIWSLTFDWLHHLYVGG